MDLREPQAMRITSARLALAIDDGRRPITVDTIGAGVFSKCGRASG